MQETNSQDIIEEWRVPINKNSIKSLLPLTEIEESLHLEGLYITNIAMILYFSWKVENINEENIFLENKNTNDYDETIKEYIGKLLRLVGGYAEKFGFILPVFGVVETSENKKCIVERWAADQDWHRGDFSLLVECSIEKSKNLIQRLLSNASILWPDIKRLKPLNSEQYLERLSEERRVATLTPEQGSLLDTVAAAWREQKPIEPAVKKWLELQLKDVEGLIKK